MYNGAKGNLSAKVVAPSGAEDEALVQALDDTNGMYSNILEFYYYVVRVALSSTVTLHWVKFLRISWTRVKCSYRLFISLILTSLQFQKLISNLFLLLRRFVTGWFFCAAHFAVRFIPRENGVHYVHVKLDNSHIRGSPFRVIVGDTVPDPGLVTAKGEGLVKAETGTYRDQCTVFT